MFWTKSAAAQIRRINKPRKRSLRKRATKTAKRHSLTLDPITIPPGLTWYGIQTSPMHEPHVAAALIEAGHAAVIPVEARTKLADPKRGGRREPRVTYPVPLMPRLVFAGFSSFPNWLFIRAMLHVTGIMGIRLQGQPYQFHDADIRRLCQNVSRKFDHAALRTGKGIVTLPGPFKGLTLEILAIDEVRGFATTRQKWFGGDRIVSMPVEHVENFLKL